MSSGVKISVSVAPGLHLAPVLGLGLLRGGQVAALLGEIEEHADDGEAIVAGDRAELPCPQPVVDLVASARA